MNIKSENISKEAFIINKFNKVVAVIYDTDIIEKYKHNEIVLFSTLSTYDEVAQQRVLVNSSDVKISRHKKWEREAMSLDVPVAVEIDDRRFTVKNYD